MAAPQEVKSLILFIISALVLGSIALFLRRPATPKVSEPFLIGSEKPSIGITTNGQLRTNGFINHELAEALYKWAATQSELITNKWDGQIPFGVALYANGERMTELTSELTNCIGVARCDSTCIRISYFNGTESKDFHAFGTQVVVVSSQKK